MNNDIVQPEDQSNQKLSKDEILRGFNAYQRVLTNSKIVKSEFFKIYINKESKNQNEISSPLKVGFIISKKQIKKAFLRNRIRRLMKEFFRINKGFFLPLSQEPIQI